MITNSDKELLNQTFQNALMAVEAIYSTIDKVDDEDLALDLNRQVGRYTSIQDRAEDALLSGGICPDDSILGKVMLKASIRTKLRRDNGASHVADMMIQGNTKGVVQITRALHDNPQAKNTYCELARELLDFEEKNIERMKEYL